MRNKYLQLLFLILFPAFSFPFNKELSINESSNISSIDIEKYLYIYEDVNHDQKINNLLKHDKLFKLNNLKNLNWGFTSSAIWLKFSIVNKLDTKIDLFLSIDNPDINELDFYKVKDSLILKHIETGEARNFTNREINHRNFLFHLTLNPGEKKTYYIRTYNNGDANFLPLSVSDYETFIQKNNSELTFYCFAFGLCLFIIIFNIYLFFTIRVIYYLYYALYVSFYCLFLFNIFGFSPQLFWSSSPWWAVHSTMLFISLCPFFFVLFVEKFLDTKSIRYINSIIFSLKITFIIFIILCFFNYPIFLIPTIGLGIATPLVVLIGIIISIIRIRKKYIPAYYFFFAFSVTITGVIVYLIEDTGLTDDTFISLNAMMIGIVIEMLILSFAIVDRFRREQKETQVQLKNQKEVIDIKNIKLEEINKELEKLSIVASKTDNIVIIFDTKGNVEWTNEGFMKIFDLSFLEMRNKLVENVSSGINELENYFYKSLEGKQTISFEKKFPTKNNNIIWVYSTLTPILDSKGNINKIICIGSDITKLKEVEKELIKAKEKAEEADHLKTSFLANMSHEIRTPLNVIMGFANLLKSPVLSDDERTEYFAYVKNSINNLTRLIGDIIDVSRIEAKQISIELNECFINKVLAELYITYTNSLNSKKENINLILNTVNADKKICILTDSNRIIQILTNLLNNALKFTEKGYIEFGYKLLNGHAAAKNAMIEFYVKDTGIGIEKNNQPLIFERFRKIEDNKKKLYRGTGLGLTISKNLVELLGGEIRVESEPNAGSTFYFTIPFIEIKNSTNNNSEDQSKSPEEYNWKNKTILIAEDELLNYKFLEVLLKPTQSNCLRAITGIEAVNICKINDQIDLILMDISMPEMDGYEATREIKKFRSNLPIIAQTAYAMDGEKNESLNSGCDDFITKPIDWQVLFEIINKHIN